MDRWNCAEKLNSLINRHVQHLINIFSLVFHFEGLPVVTMSAADIATHVDIRQKIHFDRLNTGSPTCLTPPALDIERKTASLKSPNLSIRCRLEQFANIGKHVGIGRRIATRGLADGRLIHHDQLINIFDSDNLLVGQRLFVRVVKTTAQRPPQRSIDQSRLTATAHPRHTDQSS